MMSVAVGPHLRCIFLIIRYQPRVRDSLILDDLDIAQKVFLGSSTSRVSSFHSSAVASPGSQLGYLTDELTGNDGRDLVTYKAGPLAIH